MEGKRKLENKEGGEEGEETVTSLRLNKNMTSEFARLGTRQEARLGCGRAGSNNKSVRKEKKEGEERREGAVYVSRAHKAGQYVLTFLGSIRRGVHQKGTCTYRPALWA